jgi:CHRD domain
MNAFKTEVGVSNLVVAILFGILANHSSFAVTPESALTLSGDDEVPPVKTNASGSGSIAVAPDKSVTGSVVTNGITATAAHIHTGGKGANGPVIIPLTKKGDNEWTVPPGTKLTEDQYNSFKAGNLYVNVHSAANPNGEIRAQLKP